MRGALCGRDAGLQRPRVTSTARCRTARVPAEPPDPPSYGSNAQPVGSAHHATENTPGLRCAPWCSATAYFNVRVAPAQNAYATKKSTCNHFSVSSSSLLAHTSGADTRCRCVCHGSRRGMRHTTGKATHVPGGGPGCAAPATQRVHDRGGGRPRARCPCGRLVGASALQFDQFDCSLQFKDDVCAPA